MKSVDDAKWREINLLKDADNFGFVTIRGGNPKNGHSPFPIVMFHLSLIPYQHTADDIWKIIMREWGIMPAPGCFGRLGYEPIGDWQ
ncbi:MAG TPA: hypothetical protein VGB07_22450 [Blastocatellia bacterium]